MCLLNFISLEHVGTSVLHKHADRNRRLSISCLLEEGMSDDHLSTDMTTILMSWSLVENYYLNIVLRMWDHLLNKNTDWSHGGVFFFI